MGNDHTEDKIAFQSGPATPSLAASEFSYRRLFEAAKDGILILDFETGRINDVNPFLFNLLGFSRSEMIGKTVGELSPFKDMESNKIMLERLQKDGYVCYEDLPLKTRDGRHIAVEFVSNVYVAGDQKVIQCNVRDITERKGAERERLRLAAIIEWSEDAIVSKTANGIVIGWNHGAERLYGYLAEEIIGQPISVLFPPDHYEEYQRIMKEIRGGRRIPAFDTIRRRKDGVLINVSVGITPIETLNGEIVGASKHSHDINRIKKLEAQFIEAQKMEVIGQLAGGIAHDFNNILSVIMGYNDLILARLKPDSSLRQFAEEIQHASGRAVGLTRQLLVFSRKQMVQTVVLDLNEVVQDLHKMLLRLIDENITMTIIPGKQISHVKADAGQVGQVLMNLVVNARDAMPDGGKLILETGSAYLDENYASLHGDVQPGRYALIAVSDTGSGIPADILDKVFEPFFTSKGLGKGTGLGLSMVYGFVKQSAGHITIYSEEGHGTTIKMYLPPGTGTLASSESVLEATIQGGHETILVVEDDRLVRDYVLTQLHSLGYVTLNAANGVEALAIIEAGHRFDLLFTDVIMPGAMNGRQLADEVARRRPASKVLFTSGYTENAIIHHGRLDSNVLLLAKPYRKSDLAGMIRRALAG
jgi:PAS domain S-box-containing protein